jgi:hypothetical protein
MTRKVCDFERHDPAILTNANDLFTGLLIKTLNKFSGSNNVGSVTAASLLLGFPDHYVSSSFTMINWKGWDIWLCKELGGSYTHHSYTRLNTHTHYYRVLERGIVNDSTSIQDSTSLVSFFQEYLARNDFLDSLSIYELQAEYQFTLIHGENLTESHFVCNSILNQSGQRLLFCHMKRSRRHIPSLPAFSSKSKVHGVGTEGFARLMVLLFSSFRSAEQLFPSESSNLKSCFNSFFSKLGRNDMRKKIIQSIIKDAEIAVEASNFDHPENPLNPSLFCQQTDRGVIQWQSIRYHLSDPDEESRFFDNLPGQSKPVSFQQVQNVVLQQMELERHKSTATDWTAGNSAQPISLPFRARQQWCNILNDYLQSQKTAKTCKY